MEEFNNIIKKYTDWILDNSSVRKIENSEYGEITTPFLDRSNDHIVIYAKKENGRYILTDDGCTVEDLKMSGMEIDSSPKREKIFKTTINGLGVKVGEKKELFVEADPSNIGAKKHALVQAILAVNDMYVLSQESIFSFFKEDVQRYFDNNNIIYTKDIKLTGKSGFDHNFDFVIPASKNHPERLIRTLNSPKKDQASSVIFSFTDIIETRENPPRNIVLLNDSENQVSSSLASAFSNYGVEAVAWSEIEKYISDLQIN